MDSSEEDEGDQMNCSQSSRMSPPQSQENNELANTMSVTEGIGDVNEGVEDDDAANLAKNEGTKSTAFNKETREELESGIGSDAGLTFSVGYQGASTPAIGRAVSWKISPVTPPNWQMQYEETITSLTESWKLFAVDENTTEFKVVTGLIAPLMPVTVQKIVNPEVWKRYKGQRNHMLEKKLEKLEDLLALGMDEIEAKTRVERAKSFPTNPLLSSRRGEYSLNESLLIHCNNWRQTADDIVAEGIDERLSAFTGPDHFGRGIYFVDDPKNSYYDAYDRNIIMIFTVLLGDCKDFGYKSNDSMSLKREPEKKPFERRSVDDHFFDSITARYKTKFSSYNEYVIFNRNQCYPLYIVKYKGCRDSTSKSAMALALDPKVPEYYPAAKEMSPSIAWREQPRSPNDPFQIFMPNQQQNPPWPFFTLDIFNNMITSQPASLKINLQIPRALSINKKRKRNDVMCLTTSTTSMDRQQHPLKLECPECFKKIVVTENTWRKVKCNHNLCALCFTRIEKIGVTSRGVTHKSFKCPLCKQIDGIEVGDFPFGVVMIRGSDNTSCEGYPIDCRTITITYKFDDGITKINTTAYLPDNDLGKKVAELLVVACDRRLIFKAGPNNSVVWNIPHKTSQKGGLLAQGYPDPDFLVRVLKELRSLGISRKW